MLDITAHFDQMKASKFVISVNGSFTLTVDEIWPDGDAPENPTSEDVVAAIKRSCIDAGDLVRDWNMPCEIDVVPLQEQGIKEQP